jgi:hypothetical protein
MTPFSCSHCGSTVYFENDTCGVCLSTLGYVPALKALRAFDASTPTAEGAWPQRSQAGGAPLQACINRNPSGVCNWMLDEGQPAGLCLSCRLTEVIPALQESANLPRWRTFEVAKRRLLFTLDHIGLMPLPKTGPDDRLGLSFRLLVPSDHEKVLTGHDDGVITLNALEADDDYRERTRVQMGEPMRTLLGHLRHETSHYLQYRHVDNTPGEQPCREVFGDERVDYPQALQAYYAHGPAPDWASNHVSAYASAHPWEDWAETCAHYLLVIDAVQTAAAWGLTLDGPAQARPTTTEGELTAPAAADVVLQQWLPVAQFLNAMNRSLGHRDAYPFQMPDPVLHKMDTVRQLLAAGAQALAGSEANKVQPDAMSTEGKAEAAQADAAGAPA